jgi:uncharacterized protein YbjQ (UPF0145 family)
LVRRLILCSLVFVLGGVACTPGRYLYIPRNTEIPGLNFSKYAAEGFLFTPHTYQGEYDGVGILTVTVIPEQEQVGFTRPYGRYTRYVWEWREEKVTEALLDAVYEQARTMGADAVVDLEFTTAEPVVYTEARVSREGTQSVPISPRSVVGVTAKGFAIRRGPRK